MKKVSSSIVLLILVFSYSHTQDIILPNFVEAQPLWTHIVEDIHFEPDSVNKFDRNKYSSLSPRQAFIKGTDLYLNSLSYNGIADQQGGVFEKIDINTGEVLWQNFMTKDFGLMDTMEVYNFVYLNPVGQVELLGKRKLGLKNLKHATWTYGYDRAVPLRRIFDKNNGTLIKVDYDKTDTVGFLMNASIGRFTPYYNKDMYSFTTYNTYPNFKFIIQHIDNDNFVDRKDSTFVNYEVNGDIGYFDFPGLDYFVPIYDDVWLGYVHIEPLESDNDQAGLIWVDMSDPYIPQVIRMKDMEPYTIFPTFNNFSSVFSQNREVFMTQNYNFSSGSWFLWLDKNGEEKLYLEDLTLGGFEYNNITFLHAEEDFVLVKASPTRTGGDGSDLVSIYADGSSVFHSSFTTTGNISFHDLFAILKVTDDGKFIFGAKPGGQYVMIACFDAKDFGINFLSKTDDVTLPTYDIYPNPTGGFVKLKFEKEINNASINIFNMDGKLVFQKSIIHPTIETSLDLEVPSGIYMVKVNDSKGNPIVAVQKIEVIN
jgi:hypothetical protein